MKRILIIAPTTLNDCLVELPADAARRHARNLAKTDRDGVFLVVAPIQLKAGTALGYDGDLNPVLLQTVCELDPETGAELPKDSEKPKTAKQKTGKAR